MVHDFLANYLRDHIHLAAITPDGPINCEYFGADANAAAEWATKQNAAGRNIYWTVNIVRPGLDKKPTKGDLIGVRCAHVDIDPPLDKEAVRAKLQAYGVSVVIDSGGGLQGLWWFNEGVTVETVETINKGIAKAFDGDSCWNVDRLLRLPGTVNYPDAKKRAAGRVKSQASIAVQWTGLAYQAEQLLQAFPAPAPVATRNISEWLASGPDPAYTGPEDDDTLIELMTRSRGSMGAIMGDKVKVADLWAGDAANLSQAFPSPSGDVYDRSAADSSLCSHLAFWTGKDASRMDRLFRRSMLMRDKWNRDSYRNATISRAIAGCTRVYDRPRAKPGEPDAQTYDEVLGLAEMKRYFAGCVYVTDVHRVLVPDGRLLNAERFNALYGGKVFTMSGDGSAPEKKAFTAFTENRQHTFPKVESTCFRPTEEPGAIIDNKVNVYFPLNNRFMPGDVSPFLDLLSRLLPNERDRQILLSYAAAVVQKIGVKFQWAPVLQGTEGNGKTVLMKCIEHAVGEKYTHFPASNDLANPFNSYIENKLFIGVEEVHFEGKRELLDTLKPLITNSRVEVQPKGVDKRMVDNVANWWFNTNHRDAVLKTENDRRYAVFFTAQQSADDLVRDGMTGDYFPKLWDWLRSGGFDHVAAWLQTYDIPAELDPSGSCHRAPMTSTTGLAITASMGRAEQEVMESIEAEEQGFRNGWVSGYRLEILMKERGIRISPQRRVMMMESLGYLNVGKSSRPIMSEDNKRPTLFVRRALYNRTWSASDVTEEFVRAQGYRETIPANVVTLPGYRRAL